MTAVADDVILSAAELDLAVGELVDAAEPTAPATDVVAGPMIRIVKGSPTDEDIAAIVSVFAAASAAGGQAPARGPLDLWGLPTDMHRGTSPVVPYSYPQLSHLR
ncbi:acyl-CoA carboxylase subunit epsilon [Nocardia stercoris]|uniref:Acyl-CoA carboxylase subunit epsilon n=1 Tax=Nocardia stercoris TaxID=2483361 RepID=A0A3M2L732_9NOCA|nr:acyl-CoA carboxylase subunit epsilon [Nocardia stercoris]RMI31725.1 acyl-CoA carboxylase subunit epsilon [Nocardia stercoris]